MRKRVSADWLFLSGWGLLLLIFSTGQIEGQTGAATEAPEVKREVVELSDPSAGGEGRGFDATLQLAAARASGSGSLWVPHLDTGSPLDTGSSNEAVGEHWRIGGIWVPAETPIPSPGDVGVIAREVVQRLLDAGRLQWREGWRPEGRDLWVRLAVSSPGGVEGLGDRSESPAGDGVSGPVEVVPPVDLASFLAAHGLALCDRSTAADRLHADSVCEAERLARRWRRGLHDGTYTSRQRRSSAAIVVYGIAPSFEVPVGRASVGVGDEKPAEKGIDDREAADGAWWTRGETREYLPAVSQRPRE